jgi:hypothetical protein
MLGCHDFCGYYDWTFHFVRRRWGPEAVARLWAEAIGGESQGHYAQAARQAGLAGLYRCWVKTGQEEACDWTFTLDEDRNELRWDMRQCPSKGFLLAHDLNADEDYCDHCMGWMIPLLAQVGVEVSRHEHNHCGQCWGTMRLADRPSQPLPVEADIRRDPRWMLGYRDRWEHNRKQPLAPGGSDTCDPCQLLVDWFAGADCLAIVCGDTDPHRPLDESMPRAGLMGQAAYVRGGDRGWRPLAVLAGHEDLDLPGLAARFLQTPEERRPLLVHPYLPGLTPLDFVAHGLPRPLPLLPLLIRTGQYVHHPGGPVPSTEMLLVATARALGKPFVLNAG